MPHAKAAKVAKGLVGCPPGKVSNWEFEISKKANENAKIKVN
jgi:hypothetical protein